MTHLKVTRWGPGTPKTGKNYEERNYFPEIVFPSFPYPVNFNHVNTDTKVLSRHVTSQENSRDCP